MTRRLILLSIAVAATVFAQQGDGPPKPVAYKIGPWETLKPISVSLRLDQRLRVRPDETASGAIPSTSVAVLDSDRNLLDRDDALKDAREFVWTAPRAGNFFIIVRNLSEIAGTFTVYVEHAELHPRGDDKDWATEEVFYATNRVVDKQPLRQNADCGSASAPRFGIGIDTAALSYGVSYVNVKRGRNMGSLEAFNILRILVNRAPTEKTVTISCVNPLRSEKEFLERVAYRARSSAEKRIFIFIHGYRNTFEDALVRAAQIAYDLRVDGPAVVYSWPSQGATADYLLDRNNADASYRLFGQFLEHVAQQTGATQIDVMAHSMGNWVLANALAEISGHVSTIAGAAAKPLFRNIALMAPDVDVEALKVRVPEILKLARRTTLYGSSQDQALILSAKANGRARAGQGYPNIFRTVGLDSIDASKVDTSLLGFGHQYYGDSKTILYDLDQLFAGRPPDKRLDLQKVSNQGPLYYVFQ